MPKKSYGPVRRKQFNPPSVSLRPKTPLMLSKAYQTEVQHPMWVKFDKYNHAVAMFMSDGERYVFNANDTREWGDRMPKDGSQEFSEANGYHRPMMHRVSTLVPGDPEGDCGALANIIVKYWNIDTTPSEKVQAKKQGKTYSRVRLEKLIKITTSAVYFHEVYLAFKKEFPSYFPYSVKV